jgi:hypothetical protein
MIDIKKVTLTFLVLSVTSFVVTWYFAIYLHLDYYHLMGVFTVLIFLNNLLINYLFPLQKLKELIDSLSFLRIFGYVFYGTSAAFVNIMTLVSRFGWANALALSFIPGILANVVSGLVLRRELKVVLGDFELI